MCREACAQMRDKVMLCELGSNCIWVCPNPACDLSSCLTLLLHSVVAVWLAAQVRLRLRCLGVEVEGVVCPC
jgi:hypothetical protein